MWAVKTAGLAGRLFQDRALVKGNLVSHRKVLLSHGCSKVARPAARGLSGT